MVDLNETGGIPSIELLEHLSSVIQTRGHQTKECAVRGLLKYLSNIKPNFDRALLNHMCSSIPDWHSPL